MRTLFILSITFFMLTSFGTVNSTSQNDTNTNEVYVKYSNGDITSLSGYDLLNRVDKELNCDFVANEHFGICPYDRFCTHDSECIEQVETNCICFVGHGGGCVCSLAGICITNW